MKIGQVQTTPPASNASTAKSMVGTLTFSPPRGPLGGFRFSPKGGGSYAVVGSTPAVRAVLAALEKDAAKGKGIDVSLKGEIAGGRGGAILKAESISAQG
jgi:hypothetical protein